MKRRLTMALLSVALVVVVVALGADAHSFRPWVELAHPDVEWIGGASLAAQLEEGADVMLIDVRPQEEYDVSHLPGAQRLGTAPGPGQAVVVYCSLGVRSADYAERLRSEGVDVRNLDGGIFAWANAGRPIENEEGATREVHPYNRFFGLFLEE